MQFPSFSTSSPQISSTTVTFTESSGFDPDILGSDFIKKFKIDLFSEPQSRQQSVDILTSKSTSIKTMYGYLKTVFWYKEVDQLNRLVGEIVQRGYTVNIPDQVKSLLREKSIDLEQGSDDSVRLPGQKSTRHAPFSRPPW